MKGQKQKDREKNVESARKRLATRHRGSRDNTLMLGFTYLDMVPLEFNRENVMEWIAVSKWIDGLCIKYLGDLFIYLDDYILEMYLQIFNKLDKLIEVYETRGILAFCGYIKIIVFTNCFAEGALVYKNIRKYNRELVVNFDDKTWQDIMDKYNPDTMQIYKFNKTNQLI